MKRFTRTLLVGGLLLAVAAPAQATLLQWVEDFLYQGRHVFAREAPKVPVLETVSPVYGKPAQWITLTGTDLNLPSWTLKAEHESGSVGPVSAIQSQTATSLQFQLSGGAGFGTYELYFDKGGLRQSNRLSFVLTQDDVSPVLLGAQPPSSWPGETVTLTGVRFKNDQGTLEVIDPPGAEVPVPLSWTDTTVTFTVPDSWEATAVTGPRTFKVRVQDTGGRASNAKKFTSVPPPPIMDAMSTDTALPGDNVEVTGRFLMLTGGATGPTGGKVWTRTMAGSGAPVEITQDDWLSATKVRFVVPTAAALGGYGKYSVWLERSDGATTTTKTLQVVNPTQPVITKITPNKGSAYQANYVRVEGRNFTAGENVAFGFTLEGNSYGALLDVNTVTDTSTYISTPVMPKGGLADAWVLVTGHPRYTKEAAFTFEETATQPRITNVTPLVGPTDGGTFVTLTVANCDTQRVTQVTFGGDQYKATLVGRSAGTIQLLTSPHEVGASTVTLALSTEQTDTWGDAPDEPLFYFGIPVSEHQPAPTITSVNPAQGTYNGGTTVTIQGTNFLTGAVVRFGGVAGQTTVTSATALTVVTPAHVPGAVDVSLTNPDDQSFTKPAAYTFQGPAGDQDRIELFTTAPSTFGIDHPGESFWIYGMNLAGAVQLTMQHIDGWDPSGNPIVTPGAPVYELPVLGVEPGWYNPYQPPTVANPQRVLTQTPAVKALGSYAVFAKRWVGTAAEEAADNKPQVTFVGSPADGLKPHIVLIKPQVITIQDAKVQDPKSFVTICGYNFDLNLSDPNAGGQVIDDVYADVLIDGYHVNQAPVAGSSVGTGCPALAGGGARCRRNCSDPGPAPPQPTIMYFIVEPPVRDTPGRVDVTVRNPNGDEDTVTANEGMALRYVDSGTTLTAVSPATATTIERIPVVLTGTGFDKDAITVVRFGATPAEILDVQPTKLTVLSPLHAEGTVDVAVEFRDVPAVTKSAAFTFTPAFQDATAAAGIASPGRKLTAAWADWNPVPDPKQAWPDLFIGSIHGPAAPSEANRLFTSPPPTPFTDQAQSAGVTGLPAPVAYSDVDATWGDYNNDGRLDLLTSSSLGVRLYRNDGTGFTDVTSAAGLATPMPAVDASWVDVNKDGRLDLYVVNNNADNALFLQNPAPAQPGAFTDVAAQPAFAVNNKAAGAQVAVADYDNDGFPDLYVVNSGAPNKLYHHTGNLDPTKGAIYTEVASQAGVTGAATDGTFARHRGAAWGDVDRDGDLDLLVMAYSDSADSKRPTNAEDLLYLNNGDGTFTIKNRSAKTGQRRPFDFEPLVLLDWGDKGLTAGNYYDPARRTLPPWFVAASRGGGGNWDFEHSSLAIPGGTGQGGYLTLQLDRSLIQDKNVILHLNYLNTAPGSGTTGNYARVELRGGGVPLIDDLYGNLLTGTNVEVAKRLLIPLATLPTADTVVIRGHGTEFYGTELTVIDKDAFAYLYWGYHDALRDYRNGNLYSGPLPPFVPQAQKEGSAIWEDSSGYHYAKLPHAATPYKSLVRLSLDNTKAPTWLQQGFGKVGVIFQYWYLTAGCNATHKLELWYLRAGQAPGQGFLLGKYTPPGGAGCGNGGELKFLEVPAPIAGMQPGDSIVATNTGGEYRVLTTWLIRNELETVALDEYLPPHPAGMDLAWLDANNDGWLDLAAGRWNAPSQLLVNYGVAGRLVDTTGITEVKNVTGAVASLAAADADNTGTADLVFVQDNGSNVLLENLSAVSKWLKVRLIGTTSNRAAIGAHLTVSQRQVKQLREIFAGTGHGSQDDLIQHVGLGWSTDPIDVSVTWPSGVVQQVQDVAPNQLLTITEDPKAPKIATITPASAPINVQTQVRITGLNLKGSPTSVKFRVNGTDYPATIVGIILPSIVTVKTAAVPTAGSADVWVEVTDTSVTPAVTRKVVARDGFAFVSPADLPRLNILSITPAEGFETGGEWVDIVGVNLRNTWGTPSVFFDHQHAAQEVQWFDDSHLRAKTPAHTPAVVDVTVRTADLAEVTAYGSFTYLQVPVTITGLSTYYGAAGGGDQVKIFGTEFAAGALVKIHAQLDGSDAVTVTPQSVQPTEILFKTPAHAPGEVYITVVNPNGSSATWGDGAGEQKFVFVQTIVFYSNKWGDPSTGGVYNDVNAAMPDVNNDGFTDIFLLANNKEFARLWLMKPSVSTGPDGREYYNNHTWEDVSATAKIGRDCGAQPDDCNGWTDAAWGDANNDGWPDVFLTSTTGDNRLFLQTRSSCTPGDFTFQDATVAAGLTPSTDSRAAAWLDADRDGYLDLFLVRGTSTAQTLYHNVEDPQTKLRKLVPKTVIISTAASETRHLAVGDYNRDGLPDVFLARNGSNVLLRGKGAATFTALLPFDDVTVAAGLQDSFANHSNAAFGDYDGDGWPDLLVAVDGGDDLLYHNEPVDATNPNDPNRRFVRMASPQPTQGTTGTLPPLTHSRDVCWLDLEGDHDQDLFIAQAEDFWGRRLYYNVGGGRFADMMFQSAASSIGWGKSVAAGDVDTDGDIDVLVAVGTEGTTFSASSKRSELYDNRGATGVPKSHWLRLALRGVESNTNAIGARVTVRADGVTRVYDTDGASDNEPFVHAHLGSATAIDEVQVLWPRWDEPQIFHADQMTKWWDQRIKVKEPKVRVFSADVNGAATEERIARTHAYTYAGELQSAESKTPATTRVGAHPTGAAVYLGKNNGAVAVMNPDTLKVIQTIPLPPSMSQGAVTYDTHTAVSGDGTYLVVAPYTGGMGDRALDDLAIYKYTPAPILPQTGSYTLQKLLKVRQSDGDGFASFMRPTRDGRTMYVLTTRGTPAGNSQPAISILDVTTLTMTADIKLNRNTFERIQDFVLSPDETKLLVLVQSRPTLFAAWQTELVAVDAATQQVLPAMVRPLTWADPTKASTLWPFLAVAPTGTAAEVCCSSATGDVQNRQIMTMDWANPALPETDVALQPAYTGPLQGIYLSPGGKFLWASLEAVGQVAILDTATKTWTDTNPATPATDPLALRAIHLAFAQITSAPLGGGLAQIPGIGGSVGEICQGEVLQTGSATTGSMPVGTTGGGSNFTGEGGSTDGSRAPSHPTEGEASVRSAEPDWGATSSAAGNTTPDVRASQPDWGVTSSSGSGTTPAVRDSEPDWGAH